MKHLFTTSVGVRALARLSALLTLALPASAEIIGVDHFDHPDGAIVGQAGGTFWDYKNVSPTGHTGVKSNWDYIGFGGPATISGGKLVTNTHGWAKREYNGQNESEGAINETNVAQAVYARVTVTTGATLPSYFGIASYDLGAERFFLGKRTNGTFGHEILGGASGNSGTAAPVNSTFTLVFRLDFAGDRIQLFLNPNLKLPITDPANVAAGTLVADAAYTATHPSTALRLASGDSGDPITWDNFVVATTWEDLTTVVTTLADEDNGSLTPTAAGGAGVSLREAVKYGVTGPITFDPALAGQTITLTHPDGDMEIPGSVTIDATGLAGGLTISGNNATRHFNVASGKSLSLRGLTLTRGNGSGSIGGAIINDGTLALDRCTFWGNAASGDGGAIYNNSTLTLTKCTISGNSTSDRGGAVSSFATLTLTQCTISDNAASISGGGIYSSSGSIMVNNSILAGNTAAAGPDWQLVSDLPATTGVNLIGNLAGSGLTAGPSVIVGDPKLSPLGYFGGPVQTMHPLIGSPAIDAAGSANPGGTDARGFPRFRDGDDSGNPQLDIGAVEAGETYRVDSAADPGGLRSILALSYIGNNPGIRIIFNPAIFSISSPPVITLNGSELEVPTGETIFIDASNLSGPVTISGNNASRVFNIVSGATVAMHSVRLVNGKAADGAGGPAIPGENGGGILNAGSLSLFSCTLSENVTGYGSFNVGGNGGSGGSGGGIFSSGSLSLTACTVSGNAAVRGGSGLGNTGGNGGSGGGIFSTGPLSLTACTLFGNATGNGARGLNNGGFGGSGGGIFSSGSLSLTTCTLSGNAAGNGGNASTNIGGNGGRGGGIFSSGSLSLTACTIVGNQTGSGGTGKTVTAPSGIGGGISGGNAILENCLIGLNTQGPSTPDDVNVSSITYMGGNLLSTAATGTATGSPTINPNPLLAPLGDYGGPTQTRPPLPGSPGINAAIGSKRLTDQRGFPIVGTADIGAAEYQGITDLRLFWNTDGDGDGNAFGVEHALGTNPALADRSHPRNLTGPSLNPQGHATFSFGQNPAAAPGTLWVLKRSTDLITFTEIFRSDGSSLQLAPPPFFGSVFSSNDTFTVTDQTPPPGKAFYRIEAISP